MKRITCLFVAMLFLTLTLISCVKSRVCECKSAINPSSNYNYTISPKSKSLAQADCENYQTDGRTSSTPDYSCELK
jgi:hypothetical protein